ncbi:MAG: MBL fold metallo-hydrolase [Candidatus Delongbacteria bacterium]|jgi:glyoxylase-like metal-dependent hydrolase (beta-lactamase superfamily II)|nr:MBL fold metallo-hydrolase [Candidatus Delongbacteria bacterium]MDY0017877.1 MBL fold metallo-hydrolase [Candidatus Delongbacteria bacterium]
MKIFTISDGYFYTKYSSLKNRLRLPVNVYLVQEENRKILIDAGPGISEKYDKEKYEIDKPRNLLTALSELGMQAGDIDMVILTHLHFDHSDGTAAPDGSAVFKNAVHVISETEWNYFMEFGGESRIELLSDLSLKVELKLIKGDLDISENLRIVHSPGHTAGFQHVTARDSEGIEHIFAGDIIPTVWHLNNSNSEEIDHDLQALDKIKNSILEYAAESGSVIYYQHSASIKSSKIRRDNGNYRIIRI